MIVVILKGSEYFCGLAGGTVLPSVGFKGEATANPQGKK
jgi:hypothetical protein